MSTKAKSKVKVKDLKPKKDAKGGFQPRPTNRQPQGLSGAGRETNSAQRGSQSAS